jgi:small subunit ribosomal protein S6
MAPIAGRRHPFAPALLASSAAMATEAPLYDLTLLLDTEMEAERRDQILANVEHAIEGTGEIVGRHEWGTRPTAYEVRKHAEADYHLIQFRGPSTLLEQLDHNLKITDGILRHRIIKLRPGTPAPPDLSAAATPVAPAAEPEA